MRRGLMGWDEAELPRSALVGSHFTLDVLEQGDAAIETNGTRIHDQRVATALGPRWIAWREGLGFCKLHGRATVNGELAAEATLMCKMVDLETEMPPATVPVEKAR